MILHTSCNDPIFHHICHFKQECIRVGCVPAARTWSRGVYLVRGGVPGPGRCTWSWGVYLVPGGVPGLGGVPGPGGVYLVPGGVPGPRGCTWQTPPWTRYTPRDQTRYTLLLTESQTPVKTLPWPNFVAAGNYTN